MKKCHLHHGERSSRIWWIRICLIFLGWMLIPAPNILHAQDTLWTRTYGWSQGDYCYQVQQPSDAGFIFAGRGHPPAGILPWLVKTDANGDTIWTRIYEEATTNTHFNSVQQTADGGYVAGGVSRANWNDTRIDYYLVKTDASGNTLWTRTYSTPGLRWDYCKSLQQTSDEGYILSGSTAPGPNPYDFFLVRTDALGDTIWTRTYGAGGSGNDRANSVVQTSDGAFVMAGYTDTYGAGSWDFYVVKVNSSGDTLWTRTYGGTYGEEAFCLQETSDDGLIIAGYTLSYGAGNQDFYVVRTNASGDTIWTRTFGGSDHDYAMSVKQTPDGGFIIVGSTASFGAGFTDCYIVRTDASGNTLWTRTYGGFDDERAHSVHLTSDGGYIVGAHTSTFGAGSYDAWLLKIASDLVGVTEDDYGELPSDIVMIQNYPNPFNAKTIIRYTLPSASKVTIDIYDILGRKLEALIQGEQPAGYHQIVWDANEHSSGIYFYRIQAGEYAETRKMVLLK